MDKPIKILIVEDEMIIGANISLQLSKLGYEVTGILPRGEDVMAHLENDKADIVLLDIQLKGKLDGIETAELILKECNMLIIYLTANSDDEHFERAKSTNPKAFLSKPFKKLDLQRAIELAASGVTSHLPTTSAPAETSETLMLDDRIFVKHKDRMVKLLIRDIYYMEADRNYCSVYTKNKTYILVITLKEMDERLPTAHFLRVHRSYIINLSHIEEVATDYVVIDDKSIPVSKGCKDELMTRIQTI